MAILRGKDMIFPNAVLSKLEERGLGFLPSLPPTKMTIRGK